MDPRIHRENTFNDGVRNDGGAMFMGSSINGKNINILNGGKSDKFAALQALRQSDPRADKARLEHQKGKPLEGSYDWILEDPSFTEWENSNSGLLWIRGDPGKGKTMIMVGLINELSRWRPGKSEQSFKATVSYFFCESGDKFHNNAVSVLRGLLFMLLEQIPDALRHLDSVFHSTGPRLFENADSSLFYTLQNVVLEILKDEKIGPLCFLVDALDECDTDAGLLAGLILQTAANPRVRWIVASRKTHDIRRQLSSQCLIIDLERNHRFVDQAVQAYIEDKVKHYDTDIQEEVAIYLIEKSEGTFLWVHLVCQRLAEIPEWNTLDELRKFPQGLDAFYERMFQQISHAGKSVVTLCYQILAIVLLAYRPMHLMEMAHVLELPESLENFLQRKDQPKHYLVGILGDIVVQCGSFLSLQDGLIHIVHKSVEDFLRANKSSLLFFMGETQLHRHIGEKCIETMSKKLTRDICGLRHLGSGNNISRGRKDYISDLEYACSFWARHLLENIEDVSEVPPHAQRQRRKTMTTFYLEMAMHFINEHFLHWLEVLSILGRIPDAFHALSTISAIQDRTDLIEFLRTYRAIIEQAPLQLYAGSLVFNPESSSIRKIYVDDFPCWLELAPNVSERDTGDCLQILEGHSSAVRDVAFSNRLIASAGGPSVRLWSAKTGGIQHVLSSSHDVLHRVLFSSDQQKVYGAGHQAIFIWDTISGTCEKVIDSAFSSAFPIDRLISTPFEDGSFATLTADRIRLWNESAEDDEKDSMLIYPPKSKLNDPARPPRGAIFHPDGSYTLAYPREPNHSILEIWNSASRIRKKRPLRSCQQSCLSVEDDHERCVGANQRYGVKTVKFYPTADKICAIIITDEKEKAAFVWEVDFRPHRDTRDKFHKLPFVYTGAHTPFEYIPGLEFFIAPMDVTGKEITIHDAKENVNIYTFRGHKEPVTSLCLSPDYKLLASGSEDKTIRLWNIEKALAKAKAQNRRASSGRRIATKMPTDRIIISPCSTMLLSITTDRLSPTGYVANVMIWSTETGELISEIPGEGENRSLSFLAHDIHSIQSTAFLSHDDTGPILFTLTKTGNLHIWDIETGQVISRCSVIPNKNKSGEDTPSFAGMVRVSDDASLLACWVNNQPSLQIIFYHLLIGFPKRIQVKPWKHGILPSKKADPGLFEEMMFSPTNEFLLIIFRREIMIYDVFEDEVIEVLDTRLQKFRGACFTEDSNTLAILDSDFGTYNIYILDARSGTLLKLIQRTESSELWREDIRKRDPINAHLCFLEFDEGIYLRTDLEMFPIDVDAIDKRKHGLPDIFSFSDGFEWLLYNSKKILWIPHEFRPNSDRCWQIKDNMITFAAAEGGVYIMKIDVDKLKATLDFMEAPPWFF